MMKPDQTLESIELRPDADGSFVVRLTYQGYDGAHKTREFQTCCLDTALELARHLHDVHGPGAHRLPRFTEGGITMGGNR